MDTRLNAAAVAAVIAVLSTTAAEASCHVFGTAGDDTLSSSIPCFIAGFGGNDTITGSFGQDMIYPGTNFGVHPGVDTMTGGGDVDAFIFEPSGSIGANAAVITDFTHDVDAIFVYGACHAAGVTCFWIGGSAFSGTPGETRYQTSAGVGTISIDFDGDATADYQIKLLGAPAIDTDDVHFGPPPGYRQFVREYGKRK